MSSKKITSTVGTAEIDGEVCDLQARIPVDWIVESNSAIRVKTGLSLGRSVNYGDHSYRVHMGIEIPVNIDHALSGEAHLAAYDFLEKLAVEAVLGIEDGWIPDSFISQSPILLEPLDSDDKGETT